MFVGQILKDKISLLEASNVQLRKELKERRVSCEHLAKCAVDAQVCLVNISKIF